MCRVTPFALLLLFSAAPLALGCEADPVDGPPDVPVAQDDTATTPDAEPPADATGGEDECEILKDENGDNVSCMGEDPTEEIPCPEGYTCSGLSAFMCYKGDCQNLPICLAADARIDTPLGEVPITELRVGSIVWTATTEGHRVAAPVKAVGSVAAPADHRMARVTLSDGRSFRASPGHPLLSGQALASLAAGQAYDGASVMTVALEPYEGTHTYDLRPAGPTGFYWVQGVRVASTLRP